MIGRWLVLGLIFCLPGLVRAADPLAVFTIVEGETVLTRGAERMLVAAGVRLQPDDIVESAATAGLARLEFSDGSAIDLGPATRLWFSPRGATERGRVLDTYLLEGWVKLSPARGKTGAAPVPRSLASPPMDLSGVTGVVVVHVAGPSAGSAEVFVESGEARLVERRDGRAQPPLTMKAGEFYARKGTDKGSVAPRPTAALLDSMPRPFRDTLPDLAPRFKDREVAAKALPGLRYADVEAWLKGEPVLRRASLARWRGMINDTDFRAGLVANVRSHMEWDRLLFPEKYQPKPVVPASPSPVARP